MLRQGFIRYFKNTSWLFAERLLRMIVGLSIGLWVARYLGPEQFGMLAYAQSFVALFMAFATLGLDGIVVRELVKFENRRNEIVGTAFGIKLIGSMIVFCILAISVNFTTNDAYTNTLVFIIASSTIFHSFNAIDFYFQSRVLSKYVVYANVISLVLASGVKICLILNKASLVAFAWVALFESAILAAGLIYFYIRNISTNINGVLNKLEFKFNKEIACSLLRESWPLVLAGIASMVNMRIDQVMLSNMSGYEVVGNYAAAVRIAEIWLILPMLIGKSVFPAIISAKNHSLVLYRTRIFSTIKYMSFFAVPFVITVSFLADNIIEILYGAQFSDAGYYLSLYIWTGLPYVALFSLGQIVLVESLTNWSLYITIVTVLINVTFNYLLIPIYGGVGAIIVTLLAAYIGQIILLVVVYKNTNIFRCKVKI